MKAFAIVLLCCSISWPARADITATYESVEKHTLWMEQIDSKGDVRADVIGRQSQYFIIRNGTTYLVSQSQGQTWIDRFSDLGDAISSIMNQTPGWASDSVTAPKKARHGGDRLEPGGNVIVYGRRGTAYAFKRDLRQGKLNPLVVIGIDPRLAPIGPAMANQVRISADFARRIVGIEPPDSQELERVLKLGVPLKFDGVQLVTVSFEPIPKERFQLPGEIEPLAHILTRLRSQSGKATATPEK